MQVALEKAASCITMVQHSDSQGSLELFIHIPSSSHSKGLLFLCQAYFSTVAINKGDLAEESRENDLFNFEIASEDSTPLPLFQVMVTGSPRAMSCPPGQPQGRGQPRLFWEMNLHLLLEPACHP